MTASLHWYNPDSGLRTYIAEQIASYLATYLPQDQINGVVQGLTASGICDFVLKSPDGSKHKITVANDGTLSSTPVA